MLTNQHRSTQSSIKTCNLITQRYAFVRPKSAGSALVHWMTDKATCVSDASDAISLAYSVFNLTNITQYTRTFINLFYFNIWWIPKNGVDSFKHGRLITLTATILNNLKTFSICDAAINYNITCKYYRITKILQKMCSF